MSIDKAIMSIDYVRWNLYVAQREARKHGSTHEEIARLLDAMAVDLQQARDALTVEPTATVTQSTLEI